MPTIYVTRSALTEGIREYEQDQIIGNMVIVRSADGVARFRRSDAHMTRSQAVQHAKKMRQTKIASLKKQITKLEAQVATLKGLRFE